MILKIKVKPKSKTESLEKISETEYKACIKEPAENNKANIRLINILAKKFQTNTKNIKVKNPKSRNKLIEIKDEI